MPLPISGTSTLVALIGAALAFPSAVSAQPGMPCIPDPLRPSVCLDPATLIDLLRGGKTGQPPTPNRGNVDNNVYRSPVDVDGRVRQRPRARVVAPTQQHGRGNVDSNISTSPVDVERRNRQRARQQAVAPTQHHGAAAPPEAPGGVGAAARDVLGAAAGRPAGAPTGTAQPARRDSGAGAAGRAAPAPRTQPPPRAEADEQAKARARLRQQKDKGDQ
jgi:hypothetical protein